jgi:2,3-bisphosphoglycerate-independent phosphoglycerate mutase
MLDRRILLIFVDGVGLGAASESNPLTTVATPALTGLLGGPLTRETGRRLSAQSRDEGDPDTPVLAALDARLGVEGLPQSATGQTALFTGVNAPALLGHHVTAFPGPRLKALIDEHGLLRRARQAGLEVTFANAYTDGYFERVESQRRGRHSATTLTALAAGLRLRGVDELLAGEAVTWDVTRHRFGGSRSERGTLSPVEPEEAGRHLAALAARHHLTLWETFLTDLAGHRRFEVTPEEALTRLDGLLGGVLVHRPPELTVVLTSDHGNLEDDRHRSHTENPVPLLALGPRAERFRPLRRLTEVAPTILDVLGVE